MSTEQDDPGRGRARRELLEGAAGAIFKEIVAAGQLDESDPRLDPAHPDHEAVALLLTSHVTLVGHCLPHLRASDRGRIVAIGSSSMHEPIDNLGLSNAVRPGLVGWLKTLARELGPDGITVNTIAPGSVDTERIREVYGDDGPSPEALQRIPLRRLGVPSEIGAVAAFLASDRASYVTGAVIPVDGGFSIPRL